MAKINAPLNRGQISLLAGTLDYYTYKGLYIIRKWPSKPTKPQTAGTVAAQQAMAQSRADLKLIDGRLKETWKKTFAGVKESWLDVYTAQYMRAWAENHQLPSVITSIELEEIGPNYVITFTMFRDEKQCIVITAAANLDKRIVEQKRGEFYNVPQHMPPKEIFRICPAAGEQLIVNCPLLETYDSEEQMVVDFDDDLQAMFDRFWTAPVGGSWWEGEAPFIGSGRRLAYYSHNGVYELQAESGRKSKKWDTPAWRRKYDFDPGYILLYIRSEPVTAYGGALKVDPFITSVPIKTEGNYYLKADYDPLVIPLDSDLETTQSPDDSARFDPEKANELTGFDADVWKVELRKDLSGDKIEIPKIDIDGIPEAWITFILDNWEKTAPFPPMKFKYIPRKAT